MDARQAQAMIRFGLGRRGDEPLPTDPVVWLREQITRPDPSVFPGALDTGQCLGVWRQELAGPGAARQ